MVISFYWWIIWRKTSLTITQGIIRNRKSKKDGQYTEQRKRIKTDTMIYKSVHKNLTIVQREHLKHSGRTQVLWACSTSATVVLILWTIMWLDDELDI
jgi:hypothetical protein